MLRSVVSADLWAGGMHDRGLLQLHDNHVLQEAQVSLQLQAASLLLSHSYRLCTYGHTNLCKLMTKGLRLTEKTVHVCCTLCNSW